MDQTGWPGLGIMLFSYFVVGQKKILLVRHNDIFCLIKQGERGLLYPCYLADLIHVEREGRNQKDPGDGRDDICHDVVVVYIF